MSALVMWDGMAALQGDGGSNSVITSTAIHSYVAPHCNLEQHALRVALMGVGWLNFMDVTLNYAKCRAQAYWERIREDEPGSDSAQHCIPNSHDCVPNSHES